MIVDTSNLYEICFPEGVKIISFSCSHRDLTAEEWRILNRTFNIQTVVYGGCGDYQLHTELYEGVFILKPHFFYKREGDGVKKNLTRMIMGYGGRIIHSLYDII